MFIDRGGRELLHCTCTTTQLLVPNIFDFRGFSDLKNDIDGKELLPHILWQECYYKNSSDFDLVGKDRVLNQRHSDAVKYKNSVSENNFLEEMPALCKESIGDSDSV